MTAITAKQWFDQEHVVRQIIDEWYAMKIESERELV
jgi:hypothetical protein